MAINLPNDLSIGQNNYALREHPSAPGLPYAQSGRRGTVYQLEDVAGDLWALKVFHPQFREPRLVGQAERIEPYSSLQGLTVCNREVLTSREHRDLIRQHRVLAYAILMPWVSGQTWMERIVSEEAISEEESLELATGFADVLASLEEQGLAHCDLSGPNVILTPDGDIELVDLEEMYGPGLLQPDILPGGSPGYAHKTAPRGLWNGKADRFSGAVILAEMLGWCDPRVRDAAWGEGYFDPSEMQTSCERYRLLRRVLEERYGAEAADYLEPAWRSGSLQECPTFTEWLAALPDEGTAMASREVLERTSSISGRASSGSREMPLRSAGHEEGEWICSWCESKVDSSLEVCPHCERGRIASGAAISTEEHIGAVEGGASGVADSAVRNISGAGGRTWGLIGLGGVVVALMAGAIIYFSPGTFIEVFQGEGRSGPRRVVVEITETPDLASSGGIDQPDIADNASPTNTSEPYKEGSVLYVNDFEGGELAEAGNPTNLDWQTVEAPDGNLALRLRPTNSKAQWLEFGSESWNSYRILTNVWFPTGSTHLIVTSRIRESGEHYVFFVELAETGERATSMHYFPGGDGDSVVVERIITNAGHFMEREVPGWKEVKVDAFAGSFSVFVDGELRLQASDRRIEDGAVGIGIGLGQHELFFDDLKVVELVPTDR